MKFAVQLGRWLQRRYLKMLTDDGRSMESLVYILLTHPGIYGGLPGSVAHAVTCLETDASLTADPGVPSSIPARSHTFVEIDYEIITTVILLPSAESLKKDCCQL